MKNIVGKGEIAQNCRALAYRLYNHCEKNKKSEEALSYNGLIIAWTDLERINANKKLEPTIQNKLI